MLKTKKIYKKTTKFTDKIFCLNKMTTKVLAKKDGCWTETVLDPSFILFIKSELPCGCFGL